MPVRSASVVSVVTASTLLVATVQGEQEGEGAEGGLVLGVARLGRGISRFNWISGEQDGLISTMIWTMHECMRNDKSVFGVAFG